MLSSSPHSGLYSSAFSRRFFKKQQRLWPLLFVLLILPGLNACLSSSSSSSNNGNSHDTEELDKTPMIAALPITHNDTNTGTLRIGGQLEDDQSADICLASETIHVPDNCLLYDNAVLLEAQTESPVTVSDLDPTLVYHIVLLTEEDSAVAEDITRPAAAPLNSTGIDWCASLVENRMDCPVDTLPGQDGEYGLHIMAEQAQADAAFAHLGDGPGPFDFTKLDDFGNELPFTADNWSCVRDNRTGLVWEVKSSDPEHLHYSGHSYSWYSTDSGNGGNAGTADGGECKGSACDSASFVTAARNDYRCAIDDWRLPTPSELGSIMDYSLDQAPVPNPAAINDGLNQPLWTLISSVSDTGKSWLWMPDGQPQTEPKDQAHAIRLVSSPAEPKLVSDGESACNNQIPASTPDAHFHHEADQATSLHVQTGLEWSRCALGQQWDDDSNQCTGTADSHNWQSALQVVQARNDDEYNGHDDWRLPNIHELRSIVETRCGNPAINRHVFPDTPVNRAWSSTPSAVDADNALMIDFATGADLHRHKSNGGHVRLVRENLELQGAFYEFVGASIDSDYVVETEEGDKQMVPGDEIEATASLHNQGTTDGPGEFSLIAINTENDDETHIGSMSYDGTSPGFYHLGAVNISGTINTTGEYEMVFINEKSGETSSAGLVQAVEPDIQIIAASISDEENHVTELDNGDYVIADGKELKVTASLYNAGDVTGLSEFDLVAINTSDDNRIVIASDSNDGLGSGFYGIGSLSFTGTLPEPGEYQLVVENRKTDNSRSAGMITAVIPDIQIIASKFDDDYVNGSDEDGYQIDAGEPLRVIASLYNASDVGGYAEYELRATRQDTGSVEVVSSESVESLGAGFYHLGGLTSSGTLSEPGDYLITFYNLTSDSEHDIGILTVL